MTIPKVPDVNPPKVAPVTGGTTQGKDNSFHHGRTY